MESPPKRITRARAAAKAGEGSAKPPTKIVTAAAKARAAKRKTRADENDNEDGGQQPATAARALRARPRRAVDAQETFAPPAAKPVRARGAPAKKTAEEPPAKEEAERADAPAPAKPRGRHRKTPAPEAKEPEPAKRAARGRPAAAAKASTGAAAKKTVKFQEPDKENEEPKPKPKSKEPVATGLRGRPARSGGAAAATARASTRAAAPKPTGEGGQKGPVSPKKMTQMPVSRNDSSEDELAAEKTRTPVKALKMSPIKPPAGVVASARKREPVPSEPEPTAVEDAQPQDATSSSLGSPPRRLPSSPVKDSLKSPAKRMGLPALPGSAVKATSHHVELSAQAARSKTPLLQSAAKRPQSLIKGLNLPPSAASSRPLYTQSAVKKSMFQSPAKRAMPGWRPLTEPRPRGASRPGDSPEMQPLIMATPSRPATGRPSQKLMAEERTTDEDLGEDFAENLPFSGRLSSVLPRHIDPALRAEVDAIFEEEEELEKEETQVVHEATAAAEPVNPDKEAAYIFPDAESDCPAEDVDIDPMALDEIAAEMEESAELVQQTEVSSHGNSMYQLREKDMDPCHDLQSESEDDETPSHAEYMAPTPAWPSQMSTGDLWMPQGSRRSTIGLNSLAEQFGSWSAVSPMKPTAGGAADAPEMADTLAKNGDELQAAQEESLVLQDSHFKGSFFDDEMLVHTDNDMGYVQKEGADDEEGCETPLDEIMITEDVALAREAEDMSVMEPEQVDAVVHGQSFNDSLSEASQEYGDENEVPTQLAASHGRADAPVTPARPARQHGSFYTTTKVPLKPADSSTPSPLKKRSLSASRASQRRPGGLSRSATVISYSPSKDKQAPPCAPVTPSKADLWSNMGTPTRTPRRDVDPGLLRGAVVFVDVHTTEGADASGIFVELLSQMGAHCVKTWNWNPTSPADGEASSKKVGITHVVYKDGGKRTLEKVRWANGLVHCLGVSWVLDCERENEWLDEAPFYIDTTNMPRGGARRRKSMEPKALTNLNSAVVSSPAKAPNTPANRRDSTAWMHTPSDHDESADDGLEWSCVLLTPVPKTPAPEAVARYAAELATTPDGDYVESSPAEQALVTRTCPPKRNAYRDIAGDKDEHVLMRLMAARRKSLQFAPKVGSPLSKTWG